ncbi:hypothetical protein CC79DRAFT_1364057 [Sarocladium strictum]
MEVHQGPFRHRPSVEPIKIETALMAVDTPREEYPEEQTPIFREPNWVSAGPTPVDDSARPVLLQPPAREEGMKQHDKDLVARLDRGSSSEESGSAGSPEPTAQMTPAIEGSDEHDGRAQTEHALHQQQVKPSGGFPAPPQPQQHRPHQKQKRPTPLTLRPTRPSSIQQQHRLPSLTRLVPSGDPHQKPHQLVLQAIPQQDRRRFPRIQKAAVNSPSTYGSYTPVQVVPSWQGYHPYGWAPYSMPFHPMHAPMASPHQIFSPQAQRTPIQQPQQPASATSSTISVSTEPQFREELWKVGVLFLCNPTTADAFVRAVEIRRDSSQSLPALGTRDDSMDVDGASEDSPDAASDLSGNPFGNTLVLRVVIHAPGRKSTALTRKFDRGMLRDTIPDFAKSPKSPKSGMSSGTTGVGSATSTTPMSAHSTASLARRRKSQIRDKLAQQASTPDTPLSAGPTKRLTLPPVPIHLPFARAHAPALAAVLLMPVTHKGDSIDLPMPYPGAWLETSGYMYTGNEELLNERVKHNLWYLGGVPV